MERKESEEEGVKDKEKRKKERKMKVKSGEKQVGRPERKKRRGEENTTMTSKQNVLYYMVL